jgi:hypothetical protein
MDFGLAREVDSSTQSSTGGIEGTPAFMAPEQARGENRLLDLRADIYALGATLYSVLAGRPPFVGSSTDVLLSVLLDEPPRLRTLDPGVPPALETIVQKCMEKEPARRYSSARTLAEDLGRFLAGQQISARPPGIYGMQAIHLQQKGSAAAAELLEKAIKSSEAAVLDESDLAAPTKVILSLGLLIKEVPTDEGVRRLLARADSWLARCQAINPRFQQCYDNHFQGYVIAAQRALLSSQDPGPFLARAFVGLDETRRLGESLLDAEQHAALAHWVEASDRVRRRQDPGDALRSLQDDLRRCAAIAPEDATCRTVAAQAEWVAADWLVVQGRSAAGRRQDALAKALLATRSPEPLPEAWSVLAETHLRLARLAQEQSSVREAHVTQGLSAIERLSAINPNHAPGLATQGALYLLRCARPPPGAPRSGCRLLSSEPRSCRLPAGRSCRPRGRWRRRPDQRVGV